MKNKLAIRVLLDIFFIIAFACFVFAAIANFQNAHGNLEMHETLKWTDRYLHAAIRDIVTGVFNILCALFAVIFFIFYNFKDIQWLCGSILKEMKERKEATAEERKQKKIEELEKQLDELKKE